MRDIAVKADNVGDTLTAGDWNALNEELENIVTSAGFSLDPAGGPDTDKNMLAKTGAAYGSAAWRYADSGSANTYVLARVASSSLKDVAIYHDGMAITYEAGNTNTGASTVNVAGLGAKALVLRGTALGGGEVIAGEQILAFYDLANDRFELVPFGEATETTGFVKEWLTASVPAGYLECDGAAISRTTYADLFAVLSTTYGIGDGSTTFNLPDFRGQFLRGWDHGAGTDPDAASRTDRGDGTTGDNIGTKQSSQNEAHDHIQGVYFENLAGQFRNGTGVAGGTQQNAGVVGGAGVTGVTDDTGGNQANPTNVNVMYVVKF